MHRDGANMKHISEYMYQKDKQHMWNYLFLHIATKYNAIFLFTDLRN